MATATKTQRTLQASTANNAAATTNSSVWDISTAFGGVIAARITNGATGPTVACQAIVQISSDGGTTWYEFARQASNLGNNVVTDYAIDVPPGVMRARVQFTGNTGQAVTVEAFAHELTSIG